VEADKGDIEKVPKDTKFTRPHARGKTSKQYFYKYVCPDVGCEKQLCDKGVDRRPQHAPPFELAKLKCTFNKTIWILKARQRFSVQNAQTRYNVHC